MPPDLVIDPKTGIISGIPRVQPGTYKATIKVTTDYGSDEKEITIVVDIPDDWKPVITPGQIINGETDKAIDPYLVQGDNIGR